jgi:hypothetical protein
MSGQLTCHVMYQSLHYTVLPRPKLGRPVYVGASTNPLYQW